MIPSTSAANANVSIDYSKIGACNSSILARVGKYIRNELSLVNLFWFSGDYCDYIVTITIAAAGGNASTDLSVEIIMPDNGTIVMQMSKPQITYVGGNFANSQNLYNPTITMSSQQNNSQVLNRVSALKKKLFLSEKHFSMMMHLSILELLWIVDWSHQVTTHSVRLWSAFEVLWSVFHLIKRMDHNM